MEGRLDAVSARGFRSVLQAQVLHLEYEEENGTMRDFEDEEDVFVLMCKILHEHQHSQVRPPVTFDSPAIYCPWEYFEAHVFREYTRFTPSDFLAMVELLEIPVDVDGNFVSFNRCVADPRLALFVLLRRWTVPDRWTDIEHQLRFRKSWLHDIFKSMLSFIVTTFTPLATWIDILRVTPMLSVYADAVLDTGGLVADVVCFIDGKAWTTCRPAGSTSTGPRDDLQRAFYSGYYKAHGLKMQNVMFVDGIRLIHVSSIRDHDQQLLEKSELEAQFEHLFIDGNIERPAICYGDPAYQETGYVRRKDKGITRTKEQKK